VLAARFADRIGKGIRDAPRDALIADITPAAVRGAGYGIRQALDTLGGVGGPMLAMALMALYVDNFRAVFWWSVLPAGLAVLVLVVAVREPPSTKKAPAGSWPIRKQELKRLPAAYWIVIAIGVMFTLARFSEAFLVLKAQAEGLALALIPLVFVWLNSVFALMATPAGILSDKIGRMKVLFAGLGALTLADLVLAFVPGPLGIAIGVGLWGLYMGLSQGLLSALVADTAPEDLRGTSFGLFNLLTGGALLVASTLAGWLWQTYGSVATFLTGAAFSAIGLLIMGAAMNTRVETH
jgi:MFS family permease